MADNNEGLTYPAQASSIRKGDLLMIVDHPCRCVDVATSKTGKHGHAKCHFVGIDIFTGSKHELLVPSTHNIDVPIVKKEDLMLIDISHEDQENCFVTLMRDSGDTFELKVIDLKIYESLIIAFGKTEKTLMCQVLSAMNISAVIGFKEKD